MSHNIGSCTLGSAQIDLSAEEHQLANGPYVLTLTLPDMSVAVSGITKGELSGFCDLLQKVGSGDVAEERWDAQSGG